MQELLNQQNVATQLRNLRATFSAAGLPRARRLAELLMADALQCPPLETYVRSQELLSARRSAQLWGRARRVRNHEPIQYVIGRTHFMDREFKTDSRALIPRPETELLADMVLEALAGWRRNYRPALADIGTGCGCLAITFACERPRGEYFASDSSADALDLAAENARRHAVFDEIHWIQGDLLTPFVGNSLDMIVSNPPYVSRSEFSQLPRSVALHEPYRALNGGDDGLDLIRRLVAAVPFALRPGGRLFLEIGCTQGQPVRKLMLAAGFEQVELKQDYAGHDRILSAMKKERD